MQRDTNEPLKDLWKDEIAVRKQAQRWGALSNAGFVGLVATEIPEFIAKEKAQKSAWRVPLFFASSVSIVLGVVMNWIKGNKAEEMRDTTLMIEHTHADASASELAASKKWVEKSAKEPESRQSPG